MAVPFDKRVGFCVMRKTSYESKLGGLLDPKQFSENREMADSIVVKVEK